MAPELVDVAPASALAVYAHPNDPEVSCGGTLARWAAAGAEVHVLVCTRGDKGTFDPAVSSSELATQRFDEMAAAAEVLGLAGQHQLGIDDGEVENTPEVRSRIVELIRRVRPEVLVCPDPTAVFFGDRYYNHHDHRITGWATLDAAAPMAGSPHYFPGLGDVHAVPRVLMSGTLEPNVWVDITATLEKKIDALFCHRSQLPTTDDWFRAFLRERAEESGRVAGVRYAEGFRRLWLSE
jgi:LmbE family N-acetylglucosaminyl deacetylase